MLQTRQFWENPGGGNDGAVVNQCSASDTGAGRLWASNTVVKIEPTGALGNRVLIPERLEHFPDEWITSPSMLLLKKFLRNLRLTANVF